jgi:aquaporin Z
LHPAKAFGLTALVGACAFGPVSGGHFNPAVSLGLAAAGRFSWKELGPYIVVQILGAGAAAAALFVVASGNIDFSLAGGFAANGYEDHSPAGYTLLSGFVVESVLTAFFLLIILGSTESRVPPGFAPIAIGLALTLIHLVSIPAVAIRLTLSRRSPNPKFCGGDCSISFRRSLISIESGSLDRLKRHSLDRPRQLFCSRKKNSSRR